MERDLLLLSNSTNKGEDYLSWPIEHLDEFFTGVKEVLFIPFAGFALGYDEYEKRVQKPLEKVNVEVTSIHRYRDYKEAVKKAEAIAVGGGNTFFLFHELHRLGLMKAIRKRVKAGAKYVGWSAGSNTACPTLKTTNDMPIVEPEKFKGLNVIPFQINPHYTDKTIEGHGGESRDQRLFEFVAANRDIPVIGLPEASLLHVEKNSVRYIGNSPAKLFLYGKEPKEYEPGAKLDFLLNYA